MTCHILKTTATKAAHEAISQVQKKEAIIAISIFAATIIFSTFLGCDTGLHLSPDDLINYVFSPIECMFGITTIVLSILCIKNKIYAKKILSNINHSLPLSNRKKALVFMTSDDRNNAFNQPFLSEYIDLLGPLTQIYDVDLFYPKTHDELDTINNISTNTKYSHLLICGHGSQKSIDLHLLLPLYAHQIAGLKLLSPDAEIAMDSCSTGMEKGIAQEVSQRTKKKYMRQMENVATL